MEFAAQASNTQDTRLQSEPHIEVRDLTMAYGDFVVQRNLTFTINRGDVFVIMGGSGCGYAG